MNRLCHDTQLVLLAGDSLSAEHQKHLDSCADCAQLAELNTILPPLAGELEPPAHLDQAILAFAAEHQAAPVPAAAPLSKPAAAPRLLWTRYLSYAAAAAVAICIGFLGVRELTRDSQVPADHQIAYQPSNDQPAMPVPQDMLVDEPIDESLLAWEFDELDTALLKVETELALLETTAATTLVIPDSTL